MKEFDPRIHPYRSEIASSDLVGRVQSEKFVDGKVMRITSQSSLLWAEPSLELPIASELIFGEDVLVFQSKDREWSWVQNKSDCYVGWILSNTLSKSKAEITHTVSALRTYKFPQPEHKLVPTAILSYGSRLSVTAVQEVRGTNYAILSDGSAVINSHIRPLAEKSTDFVVEAEKFVGTPYLWGGRTSIGLDCSALVQLVLSSCGIDCPRDSDMQENAVGETIDFSDSLPELLRGDLIFWDGHVAIMVDSTNLIHANAHTMSVVIEPLDLVSDRIKTRTSAGITSIRRISAKL